MARHKHADLIHAWADGAVIQILNSEGKWVDCSPVWILSSEYRIKPKTININGYDVPEPVRETKEGQLLWSFKIDRAYPYAHHYGENHDIVMYGIAHLTEEAAELHRKALLSFTAKGE
jgi:hypothetical protein